MSEETPSADENIVLESVPDPYALVKAFMAKYPHWPTVVEGSASPVIDEPTRLLPSPVCHHDWQTVHIYQDLRIRMLHCTRCNMDTSVFG